MNVILINNRTGRSRKIHFGVVQTTLLLTVVLGVVGLILSFGVDLGKDSGSPVAMVDVMTQELQQEKVKLDQARTRAEENMNALAVRLGQMQAHVIRLDALGERLIQKAKLNKGEFDFRSSPGQGGPADRSGERGESMEMEDFMAELKNLNEQIEHRSLQLSVLETMLMNRELQGEVHPAGRPVKRGWVSSYFGFRTDPFNGRRAHHDGIDIAGKQGSEVISVASGVVTWAGKRWGYGNLVEINHGNGYVTRYAHNHEIVVKVGETVKKGQHLANMGSSGRSTGPHVHFEVIKDGRTVDPMRYIRASR